MLPFLNPFGLQVRTNHGIKHAGKMRDFVIIGIKTCQFFSYCFFYFLKVYKQDPEGGPVCRKRLTYHLYENVIFWSLF